jgi:glycosyltransferase involved in cell wall biosynthesis
MLETGHRSASAVTAPPVVLQVLPALVTGGVERGTIDLAAALKEAGWTAIVASAGGPMARELDRIGVQHIEGPFDSKNPLRMRANVAVLADIVRTHRVDIVHARSRAPAWSARAAARQAGAHFLPTFHAAYNTGGWLGLKKKYNAVMASGERVIAISDFVGEHVHRVYHTSLDRLRVIPRGIDMARFDPARVAQLRLVNLIEAWKLFDGQPVVTLPGRLTHWKGQDVMIEALARLQRRDLRVLFVGSGRPGQAEALQRKIAEAGLEAVVQLTGECSDMPAAYMLSDVVVSPATEPEAFGRVIVEAQAMGRPVIASDLGAGREVVRPGETGLLVPPGDASQLAMALDKMLKLSKGERERMGEAGRNFVSSTYTRDLMCARTIAVYGEVLGQASADAGT